MKVNFVDLHDQHQQVMDEIQVALSDIIGRSSFIGGDFVASFEKAFAEYLGVVDAVAVANGTDALWLGLLTSGVRAGEAVITVPNTFIATVEAILRVGAHPLFVDIDFATSNMDPDALRSFLEKESRIDDDGSVFHISSGLKISAILPVHLYGLPAPMEPLLEIAKQYDLILIEDAAQAQGAKYILGGEVRCAGSLGLAAGFSFYPAKNLGAMGDAGAVVTQDRELGQQMRTLRDHGSQSKYLHVTDRGWNSRMDAIQAAVLNIKLQKLDEWNARRREVAALYREVLSGLPMKLPADPDYAEQIYHLFVIHVEDREGLRQELQARNIGVGLHYPVPLHLQEAFAHLGYKVGDFPKAERSAATLLSLPMHQALTDEQVQFVANACREILERAPVLS